MNMHGALNHGVWRVGVHHVEDCFKKTMQCIGLDCVSSCPYSARPLQRDFDVQIEERGYRV